MAAILLLSFSAIAGKGSPTPLHFSYDSGLNGPVWIRDGLRCMAEDNDWLRQWYGDMETGQTLVVKMRRCDFGGAMFRAKAEYPAGKVSLTIIDSRGLEFPAHDLGQVDRQWGRSLYTMSRCINLQQMLDGSQADPYSGEWTFVLTALEPVKRLSYEIEVDMHYPSWQVTRCPEADWDAEPYRSLKWPYWPSP
jgi:hypothetical protein